MEILVVRCETWPSECAWVRRRGGGGGGGGGDDKRAKQEGDEDYP